MIIEPQNTDTLAVTLKNGITLLIQDKSDKGRITVARPYPMRDRVILSVAELSGSTIDMLMTLKDKEAQ